MLLIHIKEALRLGGSPCYLYAPFRHSSLYYCTSLSCGKLSDGLKCPTCLGILCSHFSPKVRPLPWTFPESKLQVLSVLRPTTLCGVLSSPRLDSAWGWERQSTMLLPRDPAVLSYPVFLFKSPLSPVMQNLRK